MTRSCRRPRSDPRSARGRHACAACACARSLASATAAGLPTRRRARSSSPRRDGCAARPPRTRRPSGWTWWSSRSPSRAAVRRARTRRRRRTATPRRTRGPCACAALPTSPTSILNSGSREREVTETSRSRRDRAATSPPPASSRMLIRRCGPIVNDSPRRCASRHCSLHV